MRVIVPFTEAMARKLDLIARSFEEPQARVVGLCKGFPLIEYPSGRRIYLTSEGRALRPPPKGRT